MQRNMNSGETDALPQTTQPATFPVVINNDSNFSSKFLIVKHQCVQMREADQEVETIQIASEIVEEFEN